MIDMYCLKCRKKVAIDDANVQRGTTTKGRPLLKSACPACGTKVMKFTK
jgi:DNA-directed RNA polymerase subunit RPC12/RpoP